MRPRLSGTTNGVAAEALQQSELARVLDGYLAAVEAGEAVDPEALVAAHPQFAERLRACLSVLRVASQVEARADADADAAIEPAIDTRLGDFHILRLIGRGGMGIVFEAEQTSLRRRVALKVLPFAAALDPHQLRRFQIESQAAAQLHHTHIVPIFSVGCERGVHYYTMQYIEGQTLAALVRDLRRRSGLEDASAAAAATVTVTGPSLAGEVVSGRFAPAGSGGGAGDARGGKTLPVGSGSPDPAHPLTEGLRSRGPALSLAHDSTRIPAYFRTVAHLAMQAAEALDHAHRLGIIHRDIKPANLLVDVHGNLWITDFGLARMHADAGLTMTGDIIGTLRYMSPEQSAARRGIVDHRADVYSLGATLYELLTLHPALEGRDRAELLHQIAFAEPRPPRSWNPAISRDLETIVLKALTRDVAHRYATAQGLADDLRRFLNQQPIQARRPTIWDQALKWQRRHPSIVVSTILVLALAVAGLAVSMALIARERRSTETALDQARRLNQVALANEAKAKARRRHAESYLLTALDLMNRLLLTADPEVPSRRTEMTARQQVLAEEALRYYQAFLDRTEGDPDASIERGHVYLYMGNVHLQRRDLPEMVETFNKAITSYASRARQEPEDPSGWAQLGQGHNILGLQLYDLGQRPHAANSFRQAADAYQRAAGLAPTDPKTLMYLAWFRASCPDERFRDPHRAIELSRAALQFAPRSRSLWNALGVASYRAERWAESIAALTKSMEFGGGGDGIDWLFLAMAHARLGDPATAKPWYDKAALWIERNNARDGELLRFRSEAAVVLGRKDDLPTPMPDHLEKSRPSSE